MPARAESSRPVTASAGSAQRLVGTYDFRSALANDIISFPSLTPGPFNHSQGFQNSAAPRDTVPAPPCLPPPQGHLPQVSCFPLRVSSMERVGCSLPLLSAVVHQKHTAQGQLKCPHLLSITSRASHAFSLGLSVLPRFQSSPQNRLSHSFLERKRESSGPIRSAFLQGYIPATESELLL